MSIDGILEWAQHKALWGACSDHEGEGAVGADLDSLWAVCEKGQFIHKDVRDDGIESRAAVDNKHPYRDPGIPGGSEQCGGLWRWHCRWICLPCKRMDEGQRQERGSL